MARKNLRGGASLGNDDGDVFLVSENSDVGDDVGSVGEEDVLGVVEVIRVDCEKQASGGLGVREKDLEFLGNAFAEGGECHGEFEVFTGAPWNAALFDELENGGIDGWDGVSVDASGHSGFTTHVAEVAEKTKAGDVSAGARESH